MINESISVDVNTINNDNDKSIKHQQNHQHDTIQLDDSVDSAYLLSNALLTDNMSHTSSGDPMPCGSPTSMPIINNNINESYNGDLAHMMMQPSDTTDTASCDDSLDAAARDDAIYFAQISTLDLVLDIDSFFMQCAVADARTTPYNNDHAYNGCVIADVDNNYIITSARSIELHDGIYMHAVQAALYKLQQMNIPMQQQSNYTIYSTCQPCLNECSQLILQSYIKRLILGTTQPSYNADLTTLNLLHHSGIQIKFLPEFATDADTSSDDSFDGNYTSSDNDCTDVYQHNDTIQNEHIEMCVDNDSNDTHIDQHLSCLEELIYRPTRSSVTRLLS